VCVKNGDCAEGTHGVCVLNGDCTEGLCVLNGDCAEATYSACIFGEDTHGVFVLMVIVYMVIVQRALTV